MPADQPCGAEGRFVPPYAGHKGFYGGQARGRLISGDSMILIAYSMTGGTFYVKLNRDEMDVCGRIIPLGTFDWREYRLTSEDGRYAAVYVDGELISSRIPPVQSADFPHAGIYCLVSSRGRISSGEIETVRYR